MSRMKLKILATFTGFGVVAKALWRSWNEIYKQGVDSAEPGKFDFHMYNSGLNSENNLLRAMEFRGYVTGKAFAVAGMIIGGFTAIVQLKNGNRYYDQHPN